MIKTLSEDVFDHGVVKSEATHHQKVHQKMQDRMKNEILVLTLFKRIKRLKETFTGPYVFKM